MDKKSRDFRGLLDIIYDPERERHHAREGRKVMEKEMKPVGQTQAFHIGDLVCGCTYIDTVAGTVEKVESQNGGFWYLVNYGTRYGVHYAPQSKLKAYEGGTDGT